MKPAFSVIFLTTLIGVGQGLFLALYTVQSYSAVGLLPGQNSAFYAIGSAISVSFLIAGLVASFFHLGHPERAWRAAAMWRTSWLSREVIVLPMLIGTASAYGLVHYLGWDFKIIGIETEIANDLSLAIGAWGVLVTFALFLCTGMIYACIKFLQEWASSLTVINFTLLGIASGFMLATVYAALYASELTSFFGGWTAIITLAAFVTRTALLVRNKRIKYKSNLQTAIGISHRHIRQKSQGLMGGSFNTRDFFHGVKANVFRFIKWIFLILVFPIPLALLGAGIMLHSVTWLATAFLLQYAGLVAERWFFFAQSNHPQNLYYQTIS